MRWLLFSLINYQQLSDNMEMAKSLYPGSHSITWTLQMSAEVGFKVKGKKNKQGTFLACEGAGDNVLIHLSSRYPVFPIFHLISLLHQ